VLTYLSCVGMWAATPMLTALSCPRRGQLVWQPQTDAPEILSLVSGPL